MAQEIEDEHALLGGSGAKMWLTCTPSPRLQEHYPDTSGEAALAGTLAHAISELMLRRFKKAVTEREYTDQLNALITKHFFTHGKWHDSTLYFTPSMLHYCEKYVAMVLSGLEPGGMLLIEQKVRYDQWVPHGSGTMDAGIFLFRKRVFKFYDLKYGTGVEVDAFDNYQLKIYALGVVQAFGFMGDIDVFELHICQVRLDSHSIWRISMSDLMEWAETYVKPRALLAWNGEGETVAGRHCKFCKVNGVCKTLADTCKTPDEFDFKSPHLLSDSDLVKILERKEMREIWFKAVDTYMYGQALNGRKWPGYKIIEGLSRRVITDEEKAAFILRGQGYNDEVIYKPKELINLGDIEGLLGKSNFNSILGPVVFKPRGAYKLVPETAKGEEVMPVADVFKNNPVEPMDGFDFLN